MPNFWTKIWLISLTCKSSKFVQSRQISFKSEIQCFTIYLIPDVCFMHHVLPISFGKTGHSTVLYLRGVHMENKRLCQRKKASYLSASTYSVINMHTLIHWMTNVNRLVQISSSFSCFYYKLYSTSHCPQYHSAVLQQSENPQSQ